ncbi:hypothetical protein AB1Y20_007308 [Prymnesium parvum]|uniref:Calmodulin-lysine N-methyltransferase n=1 Tax=Prymnesium parvum TaxID=97485 RepID=A0AB34IY89_PRYPA
MVAVAVDTLSIPGVRSSVRLCRAADIAPLAVDFLHRLPTRSSSDPGFYGAVLWPAALLLAQILNTGPALQGRTSFELGAGTGLASLVAAHRGARAIASDVYPLSLELIGRSASLERPPLDVTTAHFDVMSAEEVPRGVDLLLAADVLYLTDLTRAVARRVVEARRRDCAVLLTDSRKTHQKAFLEEMKALGVRNAYFDERELDWLPTHGERASVLVFE